VIRVEMQEKDEVVMKLRRVERECEDVARKLGQSHKDLQGYESLEAKLREEIRSLKD
jgi:hypothetical protein